MIHSGSSGKLKPNGNRVLRIATALYSAQGGCTRTCTQLLQEIDHPLLSVRLVAVCHRVVTIKLAGRGT
jgi:hypothetical protein